MRTTIHVNDSLLKQIRQLAARSGQTLTALIELALRQLLAQQERRPTRRHIQLRTMKGNGPRPGVSLDNTQDLLDRMDEPHAPD